jgi:peptidoglycan/LPS O-acetylase OafA/YrhL
VGERLSGLDALRGIAALIVAIEHAVWIAGVNAGLSHAYLAVDFFFLLSGFVLARTYEHRMPSAPTFLLMRYKRLWPALAIGALIGAGIELSLGWPAWVTGLRLVAALTFLPFLQWSWPLNGPAWSIFFEVFANLVHVLILRRLPVKALAVLVVVCAAIVAYPPSLDSGRGEVFWYGFPRVLMSYTLGILLWRLNGDRGRLPGWVGYLGLPLMIVVAGMLPDRAALPLVLIVCPVLLLAGLNLQTRAGPYLGALSFPLYATHFPVQWWLNYLGFHWAYTLGASLLVGLLAGLVADRRFRELCVGITQRAGPLDGKLRVVAERPADV